ncbi:hypothetical protein MHK07_02395 [Moraxella nonliquefaciens]|uniref:hypothetical protein n=1 Tax=Moraxella nonliquefaciens TaxID=478 RepID=UPI001EF5276B|nr:hypothetical protein [Moraxella nonliquefaciens]MCG7411363.1 hypothetical protein [Moraxella nonliquefaciens]
MKKYYDPIILDLDGNGVGRVSKFGMLFVMNGGVMFDRNGDGMIMGRHNLNIPAINEERWAA